LCAIWNLVAGWLALSGLVGFVLMGFDKYRAVNSGWRIPVRALFTLALIGGAFGVLLGSVAFHHKSKKSSFIGIVLICVALWLGGLFALVRLVGLPWG